MPKGWREQSADGCMVPVVVPLVVAALAVVAYLRGRH